MFNIVSIYIHYLLYIHQFYPMWKKTRLGFHIPPMGALEDRQSFRRLWKERPLELTLCPGSKEDDAAVGELILWLGAYTRFKVQY